MSLSNYTENQLILYALTNATLGTRPTAWYVELHTGDPGEDGTSNLSGEGRQAVTFDATVTGNITKNTTAPAWTATIAQTITHVSIHDAVSGGNCWIYGALLEPLVVAISDPISFSANKLVASLT